MIYIKLSCISREKIGYFPLSGLSGYKIQPLNQL